MTKQMQNYDKTRATLQTDSAAWIADTVRALLPLYEACFDD